MKTIGSRSRNRRSYDLGRMSLRDLWAVYAVYPTILLYVLLALVSAVLCVTYATGWQGPLLSGLAVLVVYPVAWYFIHRYILHGRWLYRARWTSPLWKRIHFDHHQDPHLLEVLFGSPLNTIPTIVLVTMPVGWMLGGWSGAAAAFATGLVVTCVYEFIHCIQHLNYKPKSRFIQRLKQGHLVHHFHNENGNYGIVSFWPDRLLGTFYASARERPRSRSVYNLGYDLEEAARYPWVADLTGAPPRDRPPSAFAAMDMPGPAA